MPWFPVPMDDDFDKYDAPRLGNYDDFEGEEGSLQDKVLDAGEQAGGLLKLHYKKIIIAIIVLGVAYFALDFFVFSVQFLVLSAEDTEGNSLSNASIRVYVDGSNEPVYQFTGTQTISFRNGSSVTADVAAPEFKSLSRTPIPLGSPQYAIPLERNLDLELTVQGVPANFVPGEEREVSVTITNTGREPAEVDLVFEDGFGSRYMDGTFSETLVAAGDTLETTALLRVNEDADEDNSLEGVIRIRGLSNREAREEFMFGIVAFNSSRITVSPSRLNFGTITAGTPNETERIEITNRQTGFVLTDVRFEVVDLRANFNDEEKVSGWFEFSPPLLDAVKSGSAEKRFTNLILNIPSTAEADTVVGRIRIFTPFWTRDLDLDLEIEPSAAELTISGISSNYTLRQQGLDWEAETDNFLLSNRGDEVIRNISVQTDCDSAYLSFNEVSFSSLPPGERLDVVMVLSAPSSQAEGGFKLCQVRVTYDDPSNPLRRKEVFENLKIST